MLNLSVLYLVVPLAAGVASGYLLRGRKRRDLSRVIFGVILVLIFSLGFTIGSSNELLSSIPSVGLSALVMAVLAMAFSVIFAVLVRRRLRI